MRGGGGRGGGGSSFVFFCHQTAFLRGVFALWSDFLNQSTIFPNSSYSTTTSFISPSSFSSSSFTGDALPLSFNSSSDHSELPEPSDQLLRPDGLFTSASSGPRPSDDLEDPGRRPAAKSSDLDLDDPSPPLTTTTTRRSIYIRGQLINPPSRSSKDHFRNSPEADVQENGRWGEDQKNNSETSSSSSSGNSSATAKKRATAGNRRRFYNFKLLHDSIQGDGEARHGESQLYALLYGVGVLLTTSVVTVVVCLLLGICRQKIKQKLDRRRRFDKSGEYERVDSVSSIVHSSACSSSHVEPYDADDVIIEDVTII